MTTGLERMIWAMARTKSSSNGMRRDSECVSGMRWGRECVVNSHCFNTGRLDALPAVKNT